MPVIKRTYSFTCALVLFLALGVRAQSPVGDTAAAVTAAPAATVTPEEPQPPALGEIFKPTIGLGVGNLSFYGDLYTKHFQRPMVSRLGYELHLSQPLSKSLFLNFYVMFGRLGANERTKLRNENFESMIRLGGVQVMYDFSNFIKSQKHVRPYILLGVEGFEFLSKTDLYDKYGNKYYYWSDGSIKNMAEGSAGAANAVDLVRDYTYDSDIRELNRDGFGKYQERSWGIPVGAGFMMNVGERVKFRFGTTMHFTFTDYIDGVTATSKGDRKGSSANDHFMMMSASIHYDLIFKKADATFDTLDSDHFKDVDFLAIDNGDEDGDGVKDFDDECHGTPSGAKVDAKGCPVDDDNDLIPQYRDDEPATPAGLVANPRGVGITDSMAQALYDAYYDSLGTMDPNARIVDLDSARHKKKFAPSKQPKVFTVELARYKGGIPSDEMAFLLSIGDVQSFTLGDETVIYAAGNYQDVRVAMKRRDEFRDEGLKSAKVGYFKGADYFPLSDDELKKEVDEASKTNVSSTEVTPTVDDKDQIVYRVQLGAYKSKLPQNVFKNVGDIIILQTEDGYYRYCSGAYKTLNDAAFHRAELVLEGYGDAFVTAYKGGKRIPMTQAGATYEKKDEGYKENLDEKAVTGSAIDKSSVSFRVQLGGAKNPNDAAFEERIAGLKNVEKLPTTTGQYRYTVGNFKNYNDAVRLMDKLRAQGYPEAFVAADFKGEVISIQAALEMLK
jgi:hypothetical protein